MLERMGSGFLGRFPGQVARPKLPPCPPRPSVPTKSSQPSFKIRRGSYLEKLARRSSRGTTKTSVWASRRPRRPLRAPILTRNAPLLAMSPSEGGFCLVW